MHEPDEAVLDRQRPQWLVDLADGMRHAAEPRPEPKLSDMLLAPNGTPF